MSEADRRGGSPPERALVGFAERLERFYRDNYVKLIRKHLHLTGNVEDTQEAVQEVMLRLYARFADGEEPEPDNLAAFVSRAIRNALIDRFRHSRQSDTKSVSEAVLERKGNSDESDEDDDGATDPPFPHPGVSQEDIAAWKQLFRFIMDHLPAKYADLAVMVMTGKSPAEIGEEYGQDGYVLRRHTRALICKALQELAQKGDSLAQNVSGQFCRRAAAA